MFKLRSNTKELLDEKSIPEKDLYQNLKELHIINKLLGGYGITLKALKKYLVKNKTYTLVDIGCGGGDTLKEICKWSVKNHYQLNLVGIDLKEVCINYSKQNNLNTSIQFICDDYKTCYQHIKKIDILHACLFCHHLTDSEIVEMIQFARQNNSTLIINDLERNAFAYYSIKFLTTLFSKSYLVKNDAPLSVLRGFKKEEWLDIIKKSGAKNYSVENRWAFRHEIIVYANN